MEMSEEYDELLRNGMFRNRESDGKPISGSNADFTYDAEEIAEAAAITGLKALPVASTEP